MGGKREPDERGEKAKSAEERKAALRRRREIFDVLMKVLRGTEP
jgi:hypothetical protein